jgi:hypothetical protein
MKNSSVPKTGTSIPDATLVLSDGAIYNGGFDRKAFGGVRSVMRITVPDDLPDKLM